MSLSFARRRPVIQRTAKGKGGREGGVAAAICDTAEEESREEGERAGGQQEMNAQERRDRETEREREREREERHVSVLVYQKSFTYVRVRYSLPRSFLPPSLPSPKLAPPMFAQRMTPSSNINYRLSLDRERRRRGREGGRTWCRSRLTRGRCV